METETTETKTKVKKHNRIFPYLKPEKFAVVRKKPENRRYYADFRLLHETKESAETEALRLARTVGGQFYVIEILSITNFK